MTFRKNALLFCESTVFFAVCVILCLVMIPFSGFGSSILNAFPFLILILVNPRLYNEFITINETGIMCQRSGEQLWAYKWDSVAMLKKSSRFRMPSVEVITYQKSGEPEPFSLPNHYFQLGGAARKAIAQYYKPKD